MLTRISVRPTWLLAILSLMLVAACDVGPDTTGPALAGAPLSGEPLSGAPISADDPAIPDGGVQLEWHTSHAGTPPWPHILTCYGGCAAPHYDSSACRGSTACCSGCIDGTWWYATEQQNFGCGAKLELRRGDKCVIVEVADNGPASWVESNAASQCGGSGHIIDTSPLVHDYFGGGCGWSECFMVDVRPVAKSLPAGICATCPCDGPPPHPVLKLRNEIATIAGQERDFCQAGGSEATFDMMAGQQTTQRFFVENAGNGVGRNVTVGLWVEQPYLEVRRWDVYDNWTGHTCGQEWCPNDANSNAANPPHDDPGGSFVLHLNALSPGETKKIELTVEASAYSIGSADHPDVRLWVKHVDDFYEKADFGSGFNNVEGYQTFNGGDLRTYSQTDVLAAETCNGIDDDCDGVTDEECGLDAGAAGEEPGPAPPGGGADGGAGPGPAGPKPEGPAAASRDLMGGCAAGGAGASPAALLLLVLVGLLARRRPAVLRAGRPLLALVALVAACAPPPADAPEPPASLGGLRLVDDHVVSPPGERYVGAAFSPDGRRLALVVAGFGAVDVTADDARGVRRLATGAGAGYRFAWAPDGRSLVHRDGEQVLVRAHLDGRREPLAAGQRLGFPAFVGSAEVVYSDAGEVRGGGSPVAHAGLVTVTAAAAPVLAGWDGERIFAVDLRHGTRRDLFVGPEFFDVELSRDGSLALVRESRGAVGHLWIAETAGRTRRDLGVGWGGRLSPDGRSVVYVLQENDGARFTAADLWLASVCGRRRVRLTATPEVLEIEPAFAPDGERLAFVDAATGAVHLARLRREVQP